MQKITSFDTNFVERTIGSSLVLGEAFSLKALFAELGYPTYNVKMERALGKALRALGYTNGVRRVNGVSARLWCKDWAQYGGWQFP